MITNRLLPGFSAGLLLLSTLFGTRAQATPQFDQALPPADFPTEIKCGKTLVMPVAVSNTGGGILVYSATSDNPSIMVRVRSGNPTLRLAIDHQPDSESDVTISGTMDLLLFREFAPKAAGIIGGIAQAGNYDGLTFFRIGENFMAQGGGDSQGQTGTLGQFIFENELNLPLIFSGKGQLAMANAGFDNIGRPSNSCQFFITYDATRHLDFNHTVFGQLVRGWEPFNQMALVTGSNILKPNSTEPDGTKRPYSPITITSAKVIKTDDAVLLLSATAKGTANITVSATAYSGTTPLVTSTTFQVTSVADWYNDPPILSPVADRVAAAKSKPSLILKGSDLEMDEISYAAQLILHSDTAHGIVTTAGSKVTVTGTNPLAYTGPVFLQAKLAQSNSDSQGYSSTRTDESFLSIGFGDKALTPQPLTFRLQSGTQALVTVGSFLDKDGTATAANYLSILPNEINWGDGTVSTGTAVQLTKDPKNSHRILVSGSHVYPNPGIYPILVSIYGDLGATAKFSSTVNVSASTLSANGMDLTNNGGNISKKTVAQFTDPTPLATNLYETTIDWGDGVITSGTVAKATKSGTTNFNVIGSHRYRDSALYPVHVSISRNSDRVEAWSSAKISRINKPAFLPPFPQGTLSCRLDYPQLGLTGTSSADRLALQALLTVRNNGSRRTPPATLSIYYSNGSLDLSYLIPYVNGLSQPIPALNPGAVYQIPMLNRAAPYGDTLLYGPQGSALPTGTKGYKLNAFFFKIQWANTLSQELTGRILQFGPFGN